jgi:YHS domain-containing protein
MQVEPTGPHADRRGKRFWFCSEACRREFAALSKRFTTGAS